MNLLGIMTAGFIGTVSSFLAGVLSQNANFRSLSTGTSQFHPAYEGSEGTEKVSSKENAVLLDRNLDEYSINGLFYSFDTMLVKVLQSEPVNQPAPVLNGESKQVVHLRAGEKAGFSDKSGTIGYMIHEYISSRKSNKYIFFQVLYFK